MPEILAFILLGIYLLGMVLIFIYSLAQGHLLLFFFKEKRNPQPIPSNPSELPQITVQLPLFNEMYVAERLIDAVSKLNYPLEKLEIQILDDSTDQTKELIQEKLKEYPTINFQYIHRTDRKGFKAGALKEGLEVAKGEFIAIFDSDFIPDPNFLLQTIPWFSDSKVGMVQSRGPHLKQHY